LTKIPLPYSVSYFQFGGFRALFGWSKPTKAPPYRRDWALTRAPENEGENQHISLETTFTLSLADHIDMFFFRSFCL